VLAKQALRKIHALVGVGRVVFSGHCLEELADEMASEEEIVAALASARSCRWSAAHGTWNVETSIDLIVAVAFDTNPAGEVVLVVTVFGRS
jgi:hypothetical protein